MTDLGPPALLVSWAFWETFAKVRPGCRFRDYSLDSGAYSAHNSGKTINLAEFIEAARHLLTTDPQCVEVFALDVIGDWRASLRNTEKAWESGVPVIPAYHVGEPEHVLTHLAKTYPKIALGGASKMQVTRKLAWAGQCFQRVWPKPIHGFGCGSPQAVRRLPFHSVDSTTWEINACGYGKWSSMPGGNIRGSGQPLRMEVDWYLRGERDARSRWTREMAVLDEMLTEARFRHTTGPHLRLATVGTGRIRRAFT